MKEYNILYTTDNNYFIHMLTSIYSLIENNKDIFLNINIIEDNLEEINKKILIDITFLNGETQILLMQDYLLTK